MPENNHSNYIFFGTWKKYWIIFSNRMQASLAYRFRVFASLVGELMSLVILAYLWASVYRQGGQIGSYSLGGLVIYYILTKFISLSIFSRDVARDVGEAIRLGEINSYLVKPIDFFGMNLATSLGGFTYNLFICLLAFSPLLLFYGLPHLTLWQLICFIIALSMASLIHFLIFYLIGLSTFYFGFIMGLNFITINIGNFFSGNLIPIDLLPKSIIAINNFLPFKYIIFVPASIATGKIKPDEFPLLFAGGLAWLIILYGANKIIFKQGMKKYEAFSG